MSCARDHTRQPLPAELAEEIDQEVSDMICPVCGRMMYEVSEGPGKFRWVCPGPCVPNPENDPARRGA